MIDGEIDAQLGIVAYIERILAMPDCYVRDLWTSALAKARARIAELEAQTDA